MSAADDQDFRDAIGKRLKYLDDPNYRPGGSGSSGRPVEDRDDRLVEREYERERARREARRRLDAEACATTHQPEILTLRERLAVPRQQIAWRIERWQPTNTRVMLAAQFKSGKTTLVGGLIRSLVDGDRFLDRDTVSPIQEGKVALVDTEMSTTQLDDWLRDQRIKNDDRVIVIPLRGAVASFDLLDEGVRREWVARFQTYGVKYLKLDCLRPVLDALGLDEQKEAGRFLVAFDALLREARIPEACVVHHMGHQNERARGDSRLRDWPDVEWRLVRQDDDPASARFITAYGRDVDVAESQLTYDSQTRRLSLSGGSRREASARAALEDVMLLLQADEPLSGRAIKTRMADTDHAREAIEMALKVGLRDGAITCSLGPRNAKLYRRVSECPGVSGQCPPDGPSECPAAYIEPDTGRSLFEAESTPSGRDTRPMPGAADERL